MPSSPRDTRRWVLLAGLCVLGLSLRLYHLTTQSLWTDEVVSVGIATMPTAALARDVVNGGTVLPTAWLSPAYYAVAKLALLVPHAEADARLRLLSALLGTATIPAIAWAATPLVSAPAALAAAALVAISPFHVWYSQEVRAYVLLVLMTTLALGAFVRALTTARRGWWIAFTIALSIALCTHPIALVLPLIAVIVLVLTARAGDVRRVLPGLMSLGAAGVAFLPAVALIAYRGMNKPADPRPVGLLDWSYAFYTWAVGTSLGPSPSELRTANAALLVDHAPTILAVALVFGIVGIAGAVAVQQRPLLPHRVLLWSWLAAPLLVALAVAVASPNPFNVRYTIVTYPAVVMLLGAGVVALLERRTLLGAGAALAILALSARSLANLYFDPRYAKEATRELAAMLAAEASADDLVIVNVHYMAEAVSYYYPGPARVVGYPDRQGPVDESKAAADLVTLVAQRPHVWLVLTRTFHGDREGTLGRLLAGLRSEDGTRQLPGIVVRRFGASRAPATAPVGADDALPTTSR